MSEEKKFQVKDRRRFAGGEGEQHQEQAKEGSEGDAAAAGSQTRRESREQAAPAGDRGRPERREQAAPAGDRGRPDLPEINFPTFVVSLSSSVLIHLGIAPDPLTGESRKDLPLAKQTIDILNMLKDKTRGNLTQEEGELMEGLLFDLRMRYVEESKKGQVR